MKKIDKIKDKSDVKTLEQAQSLLKDLIDLISVDLEKDIEKSNFAASQRVRTNTVKFNKVSAAYRRLSIKKFRDHKEKLSSK